MTSLLKKLKTMSSRLVFQLAFLVTAIVLVSNTILSIHSITNEMSRSVENMQEQAQILASNVASTSANNFILKDYAELENILLRAVVFRGVHDILLTDPSGMVVGNVQQTGYLKPRLVFNTTKLEVPIESITKIINHPDHLIVWEPVYQGSLLGWVRVKYSLSEIAQIERQIQTIGIRNSIIAALIAIIIIYFYMRRPIESVNRYTRFARELQNNFGLKLYIDNRNVELNELGFALNETSQHLKLVLDDLERQAAFAESNPNIVLSISPDGNVQYINPKGIEWLNKQKLTRSDLYKILPDNYKDIINEATTEHRTRQGVEVICDDYALIWIFAPVVGHELIHAFATDITTLKSAEKEADKEHIERMAAEAESQTKSMFLANMSHEIRTPLTAIIGFSESLLTEKFDKTQRNRVVDTIIRNGTHLQQVINDILDLSKIEAGQLEIEQISASPFLLVGEVDSLLGMKARDKGLEFKINYHFPLPAKIQTDPTRLKQILINLISNAIKFTDVGRINIDVSCLDDCKQIRFVITDTGTGMTPAEIEHVFNPFTQADSTTTRKYGGTGLGLPISLKLATQMEGHLTCVSNKDKGSCFTLSLPTHCSDDMVPIQCLEDVSLYHDEEFVQTEIKPLAGSILLAEDSPDNQELIAMYIRKTGATLSIAEDGRQAVEMCKDNKFDLILMDMQMPVMDGLQAIIMLRANGYTGPMVSLTANAMMSDREKCLAAGADDYLVKPINLQRFYEVLNTYLAASNKNDNSESVQDAKTAFLNNPKYKELVKRFLLDLPQMVEKITEAIRAQDWVEVRAMSHNLKGLGGALGYPQITEVAGEINTLVKQEEYDQAANACVALRELCLNI